MTEPEPRPEPLLPRLAMRRLASVGYLLGRLELRFDGDDGYEDDTVLTCEFWPEVRQPGVVLRHEGFGYADALRALVGQLVMGASEAEGTGIVVELQSATLVLNPSADELDGTDVALLRGFADGAWAAWRRGEGVFAGLA